MVANGRERAISAGAVTALHAVLLWFILHASAPLPVIAPDRTLTTFDVVPPAPPPERPRMRPSPSRTKANGRAGPKAERSAVVAPVAIISPPVEQFAPLLPQQGVASDAGTASAGGETGSGTNGTGSGTGGTDDGNGSGGTRARLIAGAITPRDYPKQERAARIGGSVTVSFEVGADGRARGCAVTGTSGNTALDTTTCRLVEARFRYAPARSAGGVPVSERRGWRQRWWLE